MTFQGFCGYYWSSGLSFGGSMEKETVHTIVFHPEVTGQYDYAHLHKLSPLSLEEAVHKYHITFINYPEHMTFIPGNL